MVTLCVCAKCRKPWEGFGSPARCPHCGQASVGISIQKLWQNPEYRAKQSVAHRGKHLAVETKAKISVVLR